MKSVVKSLLVSVPLYLALMIAVGGYAFTVAASGSTMQTVANIALLLIAISFTGHIAEQLDAIRREESAAQAA